MHTNVAKSYDKHTDPLINYCTKLTTKQSDVEKELHKATLARHRGMLGAPEVLQLGQNFINLIGAKRCLDIGTFTGASALAWALHLPEGGEVLTFDVKHSALNEIGMPIFDRHSEIKKKITFHLGPALDKLDELIAAGEQGKWDFVFIDADKENYLNYYKRAIELIRSGGVIMVDNALWQGKVAGDSSKFDDVTAHIDECNQYIFNDPNARNSLLVLGDGTNVVFKV